MKVTELSTARPEGAQQSVTTPPGEVATAGEAKSAPSQDVLLAREGTRRSVLADMLQARHRHMLDLRLGLEPFSGKDAPQVDKRYFDVARAVQRIDETVARYPSIASRVNLSELPGAEKTHEKQPIYALKLSGSNSATAVKPAVVIAAQHHARELNSGYMALSVMERLASGYASDPAITKLLDERDVYIVPHANPDGVRTVWTEQRFWRKNRAHNADGSRGVDVNRNYPFLFGACGSSTDGSSEVFRGPSPGSEPESRTMMALQRAVRPELYIDFHSYGNQVLALYPPCATVTPAMQTMGKSYADRLRAPMGFGYRAPSGSGEAPQWYWSQGTLSYLVEVGSAFQPRFEETQQDEQKVWRGLKEALTTWAPAARGRVTDTNGSPLQATFTVTQPLFRHGETLTSRASDGAYSLWLPVGTWDVVVTAPGHTPKTVRLTVDSYDRPQTVDVRLDAASQG